MDWDNFTIIDLETLTNPEVIQRGIDFYQQGRLQSACRIEDLLAGTVTGASAHYRVRLWIEGGNVEGNCSCLYQGFCKHLVVLALGWLNEKEQFLNLQPELDQILQNSGLLPGFCKTLIAKDPVNFLELRLGEKSAAKFDNARELTNLTRAIFVNAPLFPLDLDTLADRLNRIEQLLEARIDSGDLEILEPFHELIRSLTAFYMETKNSSVNAYFNKILNLAGALLEHYEVNALRPILVSLLNSYFEPGLWEHKAAIGAVLERFEDVESLFIRKFLEEKLLEQPDLFTLIGVYELFSAKISARNDMDELHNRMMERLTATSEGRLWLIDRLSESEPGQAFHLARNSLRQGMEPKRSFRDRLISLHQNQNEFRQAASLSFIQFQEEPNFSEYLRLKKILNNYPNDLQDYLRRIQKLLVERSDQRLLFQIAIDGHDFEKLRSQLAEIKTDQELLLSISEMLVKNPPDEWPEVYPEIIRPLLEEPNPKFRQAALQMIAAYKKACYRLNQKEAWETFRRELLEEYQEDPWFRRKFGGVLRDSY